MKRENYNKEYQDLMAHCTLCPRECGADRFKGATGYCKSDAGMNIASICIHRGEEPPISGNDGICNIFFSGCNLRCVYCQNFEISRPATSRVSSPDYDETLNTIIRFLSMGIKAVGFVSPSHVVPQVKAIIRGLNERGFKPVTVYNTNSYDKKETIRSLEGMIDVYLPDYKYVTAGVSKELSDAPDYPEVAFNAIKEMFYQKGSVLSTDENGSADNGMLLRHLVLPGHVDESKNVLKKIAEDISRGVNISLMSQYHPIPYAGNHPDLGRILYKTEYEDVVEYMEQLGFRNGWVQDMISYQNYKPDFRRENPFE